MEEENVAVEEDRSYCVYVHTNTINGKKYVGQTCKKPEHRWGKDGNGYKDCTYFYNAIQKYGWDNFEHEIIKSNLTLDEANELETSFIKEYNTMDQENGYNLQSGGHNYKFSEEALKNISIAQKKRFESPEELAKLRGYMKGKHHSEEVKEKMRNIHLNLTQQNAIQTDQYSINGEFIKTWRSRRHAASCLGIRVEHITECCKGTRKIAGGFIWRNHDEPLTSEHLERCTVNGNAKSVVQISKDTGEILKIWKSMTDIEKELAISIPHISSCCNGERKSSNGYVWLYYNDATEERIKEAVEYANIRKPMSEETKKKIGEANKKNSTKRINQYSKNKEFIKTWNSLSEAHRELHIKVSHIGECCKGKRKTAGGFIWKYVDEN